MPSSNLKSNTENEPSPLIPGPVDKQTLIMQEKLIQKQKELLELQQKKLELEVLQTQVKLQEQIKHNLPTTGRSQNILLKPEVAKQLVPSLSHHKPSGINTVMNQQQKVMQSTPSNGTKINPVSSALINAKPIRDPRLMRQQQQQQKQQPQKPPQAARPQVADGNEDFVQQPQRTLLENNKIVTNKVGVRKPRNDPRLINKVGSSVQKTDSSKPPSSKSRNSDPGKSHHRSARSSHRPSPDSPLKSSSNSLEVPKSDSVKSQPPSKGKKRDKSDDKRPVSPREQNKRPTSPREQKRGKSDSPTTFKGVKASLKNRNYVRRNILGSASPSEELRAQDEDLRSLGPPEKQPRLLPGEAGAAELTPRPGSPKGKDVDLRQLPATIGKKRSSTDSPEHGTTAKKSKSEIFDKLFGDEDTDLRQFAMNTEQRPKTPPPPIISVSDVTLSPKTSSPKSNLDAIRAKLANATNRDKVMAKSYNKNKLRLEDQDLRQSIQITPETIQQIIISPEDENNIKSGNMTSEESKKLLAKIILQMEKNKLKEAKRKDSEANVTLQAISDEELVDSDHEDTPEVVEDDNNPRPKTTPPQQEEVLMFNDKDERMIPGPIQPPPSDFMHQNFFPRDGREMRRFPGPNNWRGGRGRRWEMPQPPRMPVRPWMARQNNRPYLPNNFEEPIPVPFPEEEQVLKSGFVNVDEIKSITIDGVFKDVRFYDETAVVFIDWDDPKELSFHEGARAVIFNDKERCLLHFNEPYKEILVGGKPHLARLGAPSREIYIDKVPYECLFGSPGIRIDLDGVPTKVQLDGPLPQVNIGKNRRTDLVAGKINLYINAEVVVPVFLDAKIQKFVLNNETSSLKFVDALKTVLINDVPFNVEYGGLPKPFIIHGKKHFIRFSVLPHGIRPGRVRIVGMEGDGEVAGVDESSQDESANVSDAYDPGMPIAGLLDNKDTASPDRNSNSPTFYQRLLQQQQNNLEALSNAMTPALVPSETSSGYQIENEQDSQGVPVPKVQEPQPAPAININDLFQKLVASGFVTTASEQKKPSPEPPQITEPPPEKTTTKPHHPPSHHQPPVPSKTKHHSISNLKSVTFGRPETLRVRQNILYSILYSGMQCSSCGMRFSPESSMLYSQHLDWHFRQNRKGKKNSRVASSRRWYYSLSDWKNYEELEDIEEREKNYFDQLQQAEGAGDEGEEEAEIPSVAADPDSTQESCKMCHDKFDQFFHEEKEEWHLKNAIRVENNTFHPLCYEDYQQALLNQTLDESIVKPVEAKEKPRDEELIPGLEIIIDDDDDEEVEEEENVAEDQLKSDEVLTLESDESKPISEAVDEVEPPMVEEDEGDDDDVILNEVAPIKIVVDDDDDETGLQTSQEETSMVDDGFVEIAGLVSLPNGKHVKIKAEPRDKGEKELDDDMPTTPIEEQPLPTIDLEQQSNSATSVRALQASIDGNMDIVSTGAPTVVTTGMKGIKINISKPLLPVIHKDKETIIDSEAPPSETYIDPFEPFPPGEEPQPVAFKPALRNVKLNKLPPVRKGTELTGMCSIM